ncbi:MAG: GntR family transcriptional regulator [Verrucomicrobiota bacterium]|nr:GntR family transcriptional regulator [Verrucomicrobiota bacterium]
MKVSLPFAIDRTSALSLIAQVSEGFRRAIESGVYRPGDILPNMEDISAAGVSMMVTRAAIRRLAADGLGEPRRRTGILVLDTVRLHWRGHVLVVTSELSDNYLVATVAAKMRVALGKAGYLVTQTIVLRDADKRPDYSALDLALREPM